MIKVTENGIVSLGEPRDDLPKEDLEEIARMFGKYEHGLLFEDEGDEDDGQTIIYG